MKCAYFLLIVLIAMSTLAACSYNIGSDLSAAIATATATAEATETAIAAATAEATAAAMASPAENQNTEIASGQAVITTDQISNILTKSGAEVIKTYNLTDSQETRNIGDERVFIPLFKCDVIHSYIGFDGSQNDSVNDIIQKLLNPYEIIPLDGTYIKFKNSFSFQSGENIAKFKKKFGNGAFEKYTNLKGDKMTYHLTYKIDNLKLEFSSYYKNLKDYLIDITNQ